MSETMLAKAVFIQALQLHADCNRKTKIDFFLNCNLLCFASFEATDIRYP